LRAIASSFVGDGLLPFSLALFAHQLAPLSSLVAILATLGIMKQEQ